MLTLCIPLIAGYHDNVLNPISLLICGFFCDFAALLSVAYSKGIPVKAKNTVTETRKLFYPSTSFISAFCSLILSIIILCTVGYLTKTNALFATEASIYIAVFVFAVQIAALGGFLLILHGRTRAHKFNFMYFSILLITLLCIAGFFFANIATSIGLASPNPVILPYLLAVTAVSAIVIVLIVGNLSAFSSSKRM